MAYYTASYAEKYRWSGTDQDGDAVTLRIYQRSTSSFTVKTIQGMQSIRFSMQGGQGTAYSPIIKTSLEFTLVDAPDLSTGTVKAGDWQEFYTPDATLYMVELWRTWKSANALEWRGYLTPDSWEEGLQYRGSITLTARDNLGHLQDFIYDGACDANGLVKVSDLVEEAMEKIDFPMYLTISESATDSQYLIDATNGGKLYDAYVATAPFEGRDWYSVLEETLEAIGYCLRFIGGEFGCMPIRNLPLHGYPTRTQSLRRAAPLEFYSGERTMDPAYKQIRDVVDFGSDAEIEMDLTRNLDIGTTFTVYAGVFYEDEGETAQHFAGRSAQNTVTAGRTGGGWLSGLGFIGAGSCSPQASLIAQDGTDAMEMGVNLAADVTAANDGGLDPTYRMKASTTDITLTCGFARPVELKNATATFTVARLKSYLAKAYIYIKYTDPLTSTVYYWTGSAWQTTSYLMEIAVAEALADSYAFEIALQDISETATLGGWLDVVFANFRHYGNDTPDYGSFVRLTNLKVRLNAKRTLKSDTITTVNGEENNVSVDRKPIVGAMSMLVPYFSAGNYPGALWTYDGNGLLVPFGYSVYWSGYAASTAIPLAAQIHKQILCFNHESMEILEGNCGIAGKVMKCAFDEEFTYKGKNYILVSGTLDVLTNRISGAILHEYTWYPNLWDENTNPTYTGVPVYSIDSVEGGANGNSVISGSGSSGGGGSSSGGKVTSVGLSAPTGFTVSGSPVTSSGTLGLAFASGYGLPLTADVQKGVTAYGWGDHAQAGYLTSHQTLHSLYLSAGAFTPGWYNPGTASGSFSIPTSIGHLSDVDVATTAPDTGNVLQWDGSKWVPGTVSSGGSSPSITINGSSSGSFYAPATSGSSGQYLVSNGSSAPAWRTPSTTVTQGNTYLVTSGAVYTALQSYQTTANLVTSISASSTDTQYPSAKCVFDAIAASGGSVTIDTALSSTSTNPVQNKVIYDAIGDIETLLAAL